MKCGVNASVKGGCFLRTPACSGIVRRLCGWLGASGTHDFESSEALEEQPAVARSAVERGAASMLRMLAPVTRCARLGDQLQLDDEVNSQIADGGATAAAFWVAPPSAICQLPASARHSWSLDKRVPRGHPPYKDGSIFLSKYK